MSGYVSLWACLARGLKPQKREREGRETPSLKQARTGTAAAMMSLFPNLHFKNVRGDITGGVVAAVVMLPMALAFGVASGLGAAAGLYGAVLLGCLAALFGGTSTLISGPTGPMTVVVVGIMAEFSGDPGLVFTTVMLGGGALILMGWLGVGRYISLVPYPVISGFMNGIGAIIIILQLGPLLGHAAKKGIPANLQALPEFLSSVNQDALIVGGLALAIVYLTPNVIAKIIPPFLLALVICTPLGVFFFQDAPAIGAVPTGFPAPLMPELELGLIFPMLQHAMVIALLCSIDSLLSALVCDSLTRSQHDPNRELQGQGIGNAVAGLFGGVPGAGATMGSVANINAGGRTPVAGMTTGLVLLAVLLWLGPIAAQIPLAVLAGILIKVGVDIIDWRFLRYLLRAPRADVAIMVVVFLVTIFVDLISAVGVGVILASVLFVKEMADLQLANVKAVVGKTLELPLTDEEVNVFDRNAGKIMLIRVDGPMSFGPAKAMVREFETYPGIKKIKSLVLDLSEVPAIDSTGALALDDILRIIQVNKQHAFIVGLQPGVKRILEAGDVLDLIPPDHLHARRLDALRHAARAAGSTHQGDAEEHCKE